METIHVMNLKSLKDSGELRIRPITVLVGQNSSGKSSLIRCIPLLKQSAESKTLGTVLWSGKYVDYGSFEESINNKAESNIPREITFKFSLRISIENSRSYVINDSNAKVLIRVSGDEHSKNSYTDITYEVYGNSISFKTNPDHKIISFSINGSDFTKQVNELYIAYKIYTITPAFYKNSRGTMAIDVQTQLLAKEIRKHVHHRTSDERTHRIARGLKFGDDETIKKSLSSKFLVGDYGAEKMSEWGIDSPHFKSLKDQIILYNLELISNLVADHFQSIFISSRYITPLRAAADRYYRIQNTSIEELDPNGSNLAMFLYAKKPSEIDEINEWLRMEVGFSIKIIGSHGHASIFIIDNDGNNATNIADTGFGISQVLPVLIQIWQQTKKRNFAYRAIKAPVIIVIEQPELHLHPKMQSRVGDVFCRAIKLAKDKGIDLRILIETHSKEIIDAIGKSIDQGILKKEDAAIYLVDKTKDVNVTQAYFDDGGFLDNWPYGFFDGV